jgi:hypothetical protein
MLLLCCVTWLTRLPALQSTCRDLAVALMHCGELGAARAELRAYIDTQHFRVAADPFDKVSCC